MPAMPEETHNDPRCHCPHSQAAAANTETEWITPNRTVRSWGRRIHVVSGRPAAKHRGR